MDEGRFATAMIIIVLIEMKAEQRVWKPRPAYIMNGNLN